MQKTRDNFKYLILIFSALGCPLSYAAEATLSTEIVSKSTSQISGEILIKIMKDLKTAGRLENRNSTKRGSTGGPVACEEIAKMFDMIGGRKELDKITGIYNEYRNSVSSKP